MFDFIKKLFSSEMYETEVNTSSVPEAVVDTPGGADVSIETNPEAPERDRPVVSGRHRTQPPKTKAA